MKTNVYLWYLAEFLLEWEMFLTKVVENSKYTFSIIFFQKLCRVWDNAERYGTARQATDDNTHIIENVRLAWWIIKATNTHSEYAILIAFPLQQWLHECASVLRYMYIACLVLLCSVPRDS